MKDGERGWPIENYGKKEQKEWLDNTLPDPSPCTAGNKEEEHLHACMHACIHIFADLLYTHTHIAIVTLVTFVYTYMQTNIFF